MRKKLIRWAKWLVGIAIVIAAFLFIVPQTILYRQVSSARNDHLPLNPSDLDKEIQIAEADNAAPLYRTAAALVDHVSGMSGRGILSAAAKLDGKDTAAAEHCKQMLGPYLPGLKIAEEASLKPDLNFHRDWSVGYSLQTPELDSIQFMVLLECAEAEVNVAENQDREAVSHLSAAERMIQHVAQEPDFDADMVVSKGQTEIDRAVMQMVELRNRSPQLLQGLDKMLSKVPAPHNLAYYAQGDLVMDLVTIRRLPSFSDEDYEELLSALPEESQKESTKRMLEIRCLNPIYQADFLGYYRQLIDSMTKSDGSWQQRVQASSDADHMSSDQSIPSLCTALFAKPIYGFACADEKAMTRTRLAQTAVRLLDGEMTSGKIPKALPSFGDCCIDPFSGKDFQLDRATNGYRLYSVGVSGKSNGIKAADNMVVFVPDIARASMLGQG